MIFMKMQKRPRILVIMLLAAAGWWPTGAGAAGETVTSTTALRADLTDQMLRALAAAPEFAMRTTRPATTTAPTSATQKRLTPAAGQRLVITARPTSATVALRQGLTTGSATSNRVTSATTVTAAMRLPSPALPLHLEPPAVPVDARAATAGADVPTVPEPVTAMAPATTLAPTTPTPAPGVVRINHADAEEVREKLKLDGTRARLVVQFRKLYGPFKAPEDLSQVSGITEEMATTWDEQKILSFD